MKDNLHDFIALIREWIKNDEEYVTKSDLARFILLLMHYSIDYNKISDAITRLDGKE